MKLLKENFLEKRKSEFGDFELQPDAGWKISQAYLDYESGLLVVDTSDEDENHWTKIPGGGRSIPGKQHIIDADNGKILSPEEWRRNFSYDTREQLSEDGKYKLLTTRVHDPEDHQDRIEEELIDLRSGKTILNGKSVAFNNKAHKSLLESHLSNIREREERRVKIDALPTLEEFYNREKQKLADGTHILNYRNGAYLFQPVYRQGQFLLSRFPYESPIPQDWSTLAFVPYRQYTDIEAFQTEALTDKHWYLDHTPLSFSLTSSEPNFLLKPLIITYFNELRKCHDFSYEEYITLQVWENHYYRKDDLKPDAFKQYCPLCHQPSHYYPRYPKHICRACSAKNVTDKNGISLEFYNVGLSGGLEVVYMDGDNVIRKDTSHSEQLCFLEGHRLIATEARFGGIVIQTEK